MTRLLHAALSGTWALLLGAGGVSADPVEDFYRGKQINLILSADSGGGYASYANAFAPYFSAHIPGKPHIVVQSMPGAGGIRAMIYFATAAPRDGTTLGLVHSSVSFAPLYGVKGATFDPRQMQWIGSIDAAPALCVAWHAARIETWQDLFDKQYIVGTPGAGSQMETLPNMLNQLFGTRIKVIPGYKGGNDIFLAMERGEINGRCGGGLVSSIKSTRPDWFAQRKVTVPIQVTIERSREFPDVPAIAEFAKEERVKQMLQLILAPQDMDRPILAPPGTPAERVAALRTAFHAAMNDPGFIAEARRQNLTIEEIDGGRISNILARAFSLPPEIINAAKDAMNLTGAN